MDKYYYFFKLLTFASITATTAKLKIMSTFGLKVHAVTLCLVSFITAVFRGCSIVATSKLAKV